MKWGKDWGFNGNFKDTVGQQCENWWIANHAFCSSDKLYAIEKGWSMIWPDDEEPLQKNENIEFLFCTLYNAGPCYEVYRNKETNEFTCYERIT